MADGFFLLPLPGGRWGGGRIRSEPGNQYETLHPFITYQCIVLDRDGVINEDSDEYIKSVDEWIPVTGAIAAIAALKKQGLRVCVATNQSGVGRGYYTLTELHAMHAKPHHPDDGCNCRKPRTGLLEQIARDYQLRPRDMLFVGDSHSDFECAQAFGCDFVLVLTGKGSRSDGKLPAEVRRLPDLATLASPLAQHANND
jgi:D-glycero-D-manno-heptose 1,7-bisphosphate phosphatase